MPRVRVREPVYDGSGLTTPSLDRPRVIDSVLVRVVVFGAAAGAPTVLLAQAVAAALGIEALASPELRSTRLAPPSVE